MITAKIKNRYVPDKHQDWWSKAATGTYVRIFDSTNQNIKIYYGMTAFDFNVHNRYVINFT